MSDISTQTVTRPLRGGRLIKWKGLVASCPPLGGQLSAVLAVPMLLALSPTNAHAASGVVADGTIITAQGWATLTQDDNDPALWAKNGATVTGNNPGLMKTEGVSSHGIVSETNSIITLTGSRVVTEGDSAYGLYAHDDGTITIIDGDVKTSGSGARGVNVETGGFVSLAGSELETQNVNAIGVFVADGSVALSDTSVTTKGTNADGFRATGGASSIEANNVDIRTEGGTAYGARAQNGAQIGLVGGSVETAVSGARGVSSTGTGSSISIDGTNITTEGTGTNGYGAEALYGGAIVLEGGTITTAGSTSAGLYAGVASTIEATDTAIATAGSTSHGAQAASGSEIALTDVEINTAGDNATGINSLGSGSQITGSATINTQGENAHGAHAAGGGKMDVAGSIKTSGNNALGLYASGTGGSVLNSTADVLTSGTNAHGARAHQGTQVNISNSRLKTTGSRSYGLYASLLSSSVQTSNVTVETEGANSYGVHAEGTGQVELSDVAVTTIGDGAYGLYATRPNSHISGTNINVKTTGEGAYGALNNINASMDLDGGLITTEGEGGTALWANSGAVTANEITISTIGSGAHGVHASVSSTLDFTDGSVVTSGDDARGMTVDSLSTLTVSDTSVETTGADAHAAYLRSGGTLNMTDSSLTARGVGAGGVGVGTLGSNASTTASLSNVDILSEAGISVFAEEDTSGNMTFENVEALINNGRLLDVANGASLGLSASASRFKGDAFTSATGFSDVALTDGTMWELTGNSNVTTLLNATSTIAFAAPTTTTGGFKTLTVNGDYTGEDGLIVLNTYLGADGSPSDLLHVEGDTSGATNLRVNNTNGPGAQTLSDGIMVVEVDGISDGQFSLVGDYERDGQQLVIAGAFGYALYQNGLEDPEDGNWYLRSRLAEDLIYAPPTPLYEALPVALLGMQKMPTLQQRVGNRHWATTAIPPAPEYVFCKDPAQNFRCLVTAEQALTYADGDRGTMVIEGGGAWVRVEGSRSKVKPVRSTTGIETDQKVGAIEVGIDRLLSENDAGDRLVGGVSLRYAQSSTDVTSTFGDGEIDAKGFGVGASLTWYQMDGLYVDAQARAMWTESDLSSSSMIVNPANGALYPMGALADNVDGFGYGFSVELGKKYALKNAWNVTPQAQLSYINVDSDDFVGSHNSGMVTDIKGESFALRLGVVFSKEESWQAEDGTTSRSALNMGVHVTKEFKPESSVKVSGTTLTTKREDVEGEITLGGSYNWSDDKYSVYGQVSAATGLDNFGDSTRVGGTVGLRMQWE